MKAEVVAREAATPGFALEPTAFTPEASAAAPQPKHLGVRCRGLRVRVTDPAAARPWALGLGLLIALRRHAEFQWVREGAGLDTLCGTKAVRTALERGDGVPADPGRRGAGHRALASRAGRVLALLTPQRIECGWTGPVEGLFYRRGSGHTELAARPNAKVASDPTSVYQGQARVVPKATAVMLARPMSNPTKAARWPTRCVKIPRKNTPRMIPVVNPAIGEHGLDHRLAEHRPAEGNEDLHEAEDEGEAAGHAQQVLRRGVGP